MGNDEPTGKARGGIARAKSLTAAERTEIASNAAKKRWAASFRNTVNSNENNRLGEIMAAQRNTLPTQASLDLGIQKQIEIDGVGMGVLSDGTPFLTGGGLARLCGVAASQIQRISADWATTSPNPRMAKIREILKSRGAERIERPYVEITQRSGIFYAYPDVVCLAILEYYAFDARSPDKEIAQKNYRLLAGSALHDFIYTQVGYDPTNAVPDAWRQFHDRVSLTYNSVPKGYFAIFKEMADMIVTLGQSGLHIDESFVPDISVGMAWSKHWTAENCAAQHGERTKYEHNYPNYFPQSGSNPQEPWCYPEAALGDFRKWLREKYIEGGKFQSYLESKVKDRKLPVSFAQLAVAAYGNDSKHPS